MVSLAKLCSRWLPSDRLCSRFRPVRAERDIPNIAGDFYGRGRGLSTPRSEAEPSGVFAFVAKRGLTGRDHARSLSPRLGMARCRLAPLPLAFASARLRL